jgi:MoxR-like ATPase
MQTGEDIRRLNEKILSLSSFVDAIKVELAKTIVGQQYLVDRLLMGLLSNGHLLLEGVPGLAKTLTIKSLAGTIAASFSRIQFTPDLLPADVTGTLIYYQQRHEFIVRKGPLFANLVLADEINRAPAKVQSALLEAMQERQVTISDVSYRLDDPFLVMATQNPLEQEGTYPLPEAQLDRFMLKVVVAYPTREEEQLVIRRQTSDHEQFNPQQVASLQEIFVGRQLTRQVYLDEKIEKYITDIVFATRYPDDYGLGKLRPLLRFGASPRASINLALAAKANAFLQKRGFVIPDDIKSVAKDVLRHRLGLTYEAEAENVSTEQIIEEIIRTVKIP